LSFIFAFADLELGGLATQMGLLRLPRMKEILGRKIQGFRQSDVDPLTVPFQNKKREKQRKTQLQEEFARREERWAERQKLQEKPVAAPKQRSRTEKRQVKRTEAKDDWEDLAKEERLAKKLRKQKISAAEYKRLLKGGDGDDGGSDDDSDFGSDMSDMSDDSDAPAKKKRNTDGRLIEDKDGLRARKVLTMSRKNKSKGKKQKNKKRR
jgi:ATP-dependent RNA helicase DDX55/SPB4